MVQQVNLCFPILRKQKTPFTGQTLLQAWLILLVLGGVVGVAWIWNLKQASASLSATLATQSTELEALRAALVENQTGEAPAQTDAERTLVQRSAALERRVAVLAALQQGHFQPGFGQAARLQLVARTIPPEAWVTQITANERALEMTGFTLEPAVLTTWVNRLSESPLLQGQTLSSVTVEQVKPEALLTAAVVTGESGAAPAPELAKPVIWSFTLLSNMASPVVIQGTKP